ncbi:MAG: helix-turn-helix domain-containing protein [Actinomycetia bacterium]|nr:helix-turn-helix domain-containing protein [Actinomycetes bacterium]
MTGSRQSLHGVAGERFGNLLRRQRLADDLTQAELGERFGVRQQTVGAWERGERPQSRLVEALAQYVGLEDEHALISLLDAEASDPPAASESPLRSPPVPDGDVVKMLAETYASGLLTGSLSADDHMTMRAFIEYFQSRQSE